jgi:hypothetical protein
LQARWEDRGPFDDPRREQEIDQPPRHEPIPVDDVPACCGSPAQLVGQADQFEHRLYLD